MATCFKPTDMLCRCGEVEQDLFMPDWEKCGVRKWGFVYIGNQFKRTYHIPAWILSDDLVHMLLKLNSTNIFIYQKQLYWNTNGFEFTSKQKTVLPDEDSSLSNLLTNQSRFFENLAQLLRLPRIRAAGENEQKNWFYYISNPQKKIPLIVTCYIELHEHQFHPSASSTVGRDMTGYISY